MGGRGLKLSPRPRRLFARRRLRGSDRCGSWTAHHPPRRYRDTTGRCKGPAATWGPGLGATGWEPRRTGSTAGQPPPARRVPMERGGGVGSDPGAGGGTGTPEAEGNAAPQAAPAAGAVRDGGKDETGQENPAGAALARAEPGDSTALTAPEPQAEKAPAAAEPKGGKSEPREEKTQAVGEPEGGKAKPVVEGKGPAAAGAQDGGKEEPTKEQTSGGSKTEGGGKAEPTEKAPDAAGSGGQKAKPTKQTNEKTTAAAEEKVPAAAKAQDVGKKTAKAEKTPSDKKPGKEKAPATVKAQDGENKVAKPEAPAAKKAQDGGKEEPGEEKPAAPEKEKALVAAKAVDGGKAVAKTEKSPAAKKPQGGSKKEPSKEKATAAAKKAQDGGKKAAKAGDGGKEPTAAATAQGEGEKAAKVETPRVPEPPRPALLQSLSCPAACQREDQPRVEAAEMEMILEEATAEEPREGSAEPGPAPPAPGDPPEPPDSSGTIGTPPQRTLPHAGGQPPPPPGAVEQPGPGGQPFSGVAEAPPSPYLTPDFGREDPFEILDDVPPPPAPFAHRIVTLRSASVTSQFNLSSKEILGGGKFGEVHACTEKQTGLKLAAKVIRKQGAKDKEMVLLEIDVMNQLNHHNLIQLYDAIETPREIILFMEFVEGGELFERIIDDDYQLTEVDCMVFVRQICEGIRFMHHMRVLHLDLKPENILCVTATGHMVKIIDFGLARRFNPQEKLKVNFGTPEFLSPEVVNYEQVSYSTDMWSMGVITYMLLSGLSPFLGDDDTETLNNVLAAKWYFDEETFESVSEEAKDFVSNLIIKEKSARMSAGQCLQHPWLNNLAEKAKRSNRRLKSQVLLKKYVMRRRWKKNFIGVCAANRFKKITSSGSLTALGV
ncbi:myosin light chain kinase 2, skeletal/cardiac muscle [Phaethornis superciliosus]